MLFNRGKFRLINHHAEVVSFEVVVRNVVHDQIVAKPEEYSQIYFRNLRILHRCYAEAAAREAIAFSLVLAETA